MFGLSLQSGAGNVGELMPIELTDQRRTPGASEPSPQRLQEFWARSLDCIYSVASDGRITSLNPAFEAVTRFPAEKWVGRSFLKLIHPGDHACARRLFLQALAGEATPTVDLRVRTTDDTFIEVEFSGLSRSGAGQPIEVSGIARDVTAARATLRQLRQKQQIIENALEGIVLVSADNRVIYMNREAERISGWSAVAGLGRDPAELLHWEEPGRTAALRAGVEAHGAWRGEVRARARDGRMMVLDIRSQRLLAHDGTPGGRVTLVADITEKKRTEEQLFHAQRVESLGMLAAGIAHDLNNVIAPIMFAAPLLRASPNEREQSLLLTTLEQSATRAASLVRQIVAFSRNSAGSFAITQVKHIARDLVGMMEETFPKSICVEHEIPSDLWPVSGNATQIHQVLLNLCVNARDAMPDGGTLSIRAANRRLSQADASALPGSAPGAWAVLEVADTGVGMSHAVLESIWTPFFTTKGASGTGLGLPTVKAIVANHHGFVTVESKQGAGSLFAVWIPAIGQDGLELNHAADRNQIAAASSLGKGEHIVVVDDEPAVRDLITAVLQRSGYTVTKYHNAVEARQFLRPEMNADLIIIDLDMPGLDGAAFAQELRTRVESVRIIGMSGAAAGTSMVKIDQLKSFSRAFLPKPFHAQELLGTVAGVLQGAKLRPPAHEAG